MSKTTTIDKLQLVEARTSDKVQESSIVEYRKGAAASNPADARQGYTEEND